MQRAAKSVFWVLVIAILALPQPPVFASEPSVSNDPPGRGFNRDNDIEMTRSVISIHDENGRHYDITSLLVVSSVPGLKDDLAYVYGASTHNVVRRQSENRIGLIRDVPLIGKLFSDRVRSSDFSEANRVGAAYLSEGVLLVDVRTTLPGESERLPAPSAADITQALEGQRSLRGQTDSVLMGRNGAKVEIGVVSVLNRDHSNAIMARDFIAQTGDVSFFGQPVGGVSGSTPALSKIPLIGSLFSQVGDVHKSGESLLILIRPSIVDR